MKDQLKLFAILELYKANFQMLHWKTKGRSFDRFHVNITESYYEKLEKDTDDVAEILMRQGVSPLNYFEVVAILNSDGKKCKIVDSKRDYSGDEIVKYTDVFFKDILDQILECLDSDEIKDRKENVGIKSYYENLYNEYDKEYRFLNRRRMCDDCSHDNNKD